MRRTVPISLGEREVGVVTFPFNLASLPVNSNDSSSVATAAMASTQVAAKTENENEKEKKSLEKSVSAAKAEEAPLRIRVAPTMDLTAPTTEDSSACTTSSASNTMMRECVDLDEIEATIGMEAIPDIDRAAIATAACTATPCCKVSRTANANANSNSKNTNATFNVVKMDDRLVVSFHLPSLSSAASAELSIENDTLRLLAEEYMASVPLHDYVAAAGQRVNDMQIKAKFSKKKRILKVTVNCCK